jgi:hypothetical protein
MLVVVRGVVVEEEADDRDQHLEEFRRLRPHRWQDDPAWIDNYIHATSGEERAAVLAAWVGATGGRLVGTEAVLPPLPRRLAALELRRLLRQAGIGVTVAVSLGGTDTDGRVAVGARTCPAG